MKIEEEIFLGYQLEEKKLEEYGFTLKEGHYFASFPMEVESFRADIVISSKNVEGRIYDETFGDEYVLFRNDKVVGEFVGSVREAYKKVLLDIRNHCYQKVLFIDEQSTRIAQYIIDKYGDQPEFPWKKYPQFAIFRNKNNHRWYAVFMVVKDGTLGENISGRSIINIKPKQEDYQSLIKQDNIFPGWHMNKKSWITVSLSDYFSDEYVKTLIDMSYQKINGSK